MFALKEYPKLFQSCSILSKVHYLLSCNPGSAVSLKSDDSLTHSSVIVPLHSAELHCPNPALKVHSCLPLLLEDTPLHGASPARLDHNSSLIMSADVPPDIPASTCCLEDDGGLFQFQKSFSFLSLKNAGPIVSLDHNSRQSHGPETDLHSVLVEYRLDHGGSLMPTSNLLPHLLASVCCLKDDCCLAHFQVLCPLCFG